MKATYKEIEKVLNNTFEINTMESSNKYQAIKSVEDLAIMRVGTKIQKTQHHFNKSDWKRVSSEIKYQIA